MPKTVCAAFNCRNTGVHNRPKDIKLRKLWEEALNRNNPLPLVWSRPSLCATHFTPDVYLQYEQTGGTTDSQASALESSKPDRAPNIHKRPLKCNACKKQFKTCCLQFRHQITHEHYCTVCRRSFLNRSGLSSHECRVCDECNHSFSRNWTLVYHKKHACQLKRNRFKHEEICVRCLTCSDCSETFPTPTQLREHLVKVGLSSRTCKRNREKVEHTCRVCEERFEKILDLKSHMRIHRAPAKSYSRAKRQLTGAVDKITNSKYTECTVPDVNGTDIKMEIDATSPKIQQIRLEDIKKELEERQIDTNKGPLKEDTQVKMENDLLNMAPQAGPLQVSKTIVQRICSDWSDGNEELVELERVKQETEER